jgi:hypothetical protein
MTLSWARSRRAFTTCFLGLCLFLGGAVPVFSFALNGYRWPDGSQIAMHLQLEHVSGALQDGSVSWNASAADALSIWNQYVDTVQFAAADPSGSSGSDGVNEVLFSGTVYGDSWPSNALAVTLKMSSQGSVFTETDVLFNDNLKWNSYRGPLQRSVSGSTYDFHRVALHEFGHVLGLDHPDQHGQSVIAIMNSIISDLDHLADDDIAGARFLYALKLTSSLTPPSVRSGDAFSYQVTANNRSSSYAATGLPPGLQLDAATGLISGRCSASGTFPVDITVQGTLGTATGRVQIVITPLPITSTTNIQVQVGENMSYQISAGNNPTSYGATGLPAALQLNSSTGLISGVPQNAGTFVARIIADSATSEAAGNLQIVVMPPRITSSTLPAAVELGDPFTYQITATNAPTSFGVVGLPAGLELNPATGLISGTSTSAGVFRVTVTAETSFGTASASVQIVIGAPRITSPPFVSSIDIGSDFTYQILGSNHPYFFTATGLPAGLSVDPVSGEIHGVAELSGQYQVQITATGATGTASATLTITIRLLDSPDTPLKKIPLFVYGTIVADPARPRLYAGTNSGIAVIDTDSLTVLQTVPIPLFKSDLSISADGSKLWVTSYYDPKIRAIDLNSLTVSTTVTTSLYPKLVREGADGSLYVTDYNQNDVIQVDTASGAILNRFNAGAVGGYSTMEISPDHRTLYVVSLSFTGPVASYNLVPGAAPTLVQRVSTLGAQSYARRIAVSPNGASISIAARHDNSLPPDPTVVRSAGDLNIVQGNLTSPTFPSDIVYSADGSLLFQAMQQRSRIDVFNVANSQLARTITLPDRALPADDFSVTQSMAVDRTNSYFFAASTNSLGGAVYVYSLAPPARPTAPAKSLLNISTRLRTLAGDNALIGGFILNGTEPKNIVLRAMGPSLPVSGKLADPVLQLFDSKGALIAENDNWNAHRADVLATNIPPADEHEAVIAASLQPGSYTAVVRGVNGATGVALVEAYDLSPTSNSKLANISTRGEVEAGDNVMIGGFILGGDQTTTVVVRAMGPSLTNFGVGGALNDPMLEVYDSNGVLLALDDDWRMYQEQPLIQAGLAPSDDRESAMLLLLQPGAYTAIVRGKNDSVGVGLVEVYNLDAQ